jgi:hypothetical protein
MAVFMVGRSRMAAITLFVFDSFSFRSGLDAG